FEVINERHSIRAYENRSIEADSLQKILEAVNRAPSAGNLQAYEVYVVADSDCKRALVRASHGQEFLAQASVVLVFCANAALSRVRYEKRGMELYCLQDATIACTFAMLAATALGLSTVWVGAFDEKAARQIIKAPEGHRPVAMLPIGYAAEPPRLRPRRKLGDFVHQVW
ncbi:MAG: nitroreductase family protein, partial [Chloroflexota bacterium]